MPKSLISLIGRATCGGVGMQNDLQKLGTQYPEFASATAAAARRAVDLAVPSAVRAPQVLRCAPRQVSSLEKVTARCLPGYWLHKDLVKVREVDWEAWPLRAEESAYAVNDAYASALVLRRLLHPQMMPTADRMQPAPLVTTTLPPRAAPPPRRSPRRGSSDAQGAASVREEVAVAVGVESSEEEGV